MPLSISLSPGDTIYKFQLKRKIGGGNFGDVWLAHDLAISRDVAVKILDESMAPVTANLEEARVGNRLDHANLVKVHYADVTTIGSHNVAIIAMDFHPTGSIMNQLNPSNFITIISALNLTIDILRGLEYLHEQSLFHNDIKPSNILIGPQGEGILTDYGISCSSPGLTPTTAPDAYILHRAPETEETGDISILTDIYQVGLTLFRIINGIGLIRDLKNLLGDDQFEELKKKNKIPKENDYQLFIPTAVKKIINKAVKANPADRFQSALEMRRALERIRICGHWTTNSSGNYIGYSENYIFTYAISRNRFGFKFDAHKERIGSGRKTRISSFSGNKLSAKDSNKKIKAFMQAVVAGTA